MARSSASCCRPGATGQPPGACSPGRCVPAQSPPKSATGRAPVDPRVLDELVPSALHIVEQDASDPVEADHGRLKARLRPRRGLKRHRSARILAAGHAFMQNLRRGHDDTATEAPTCHRLGVAVDDLALAI